MTHEVTMTAAVAAVRKEVRRFGLSVMGGLLFTAVVGGGSATVIVAVVGGDPVRGLLVFPVAVLFGEWLLRRATGQRSADVWRRELAGVDRGGFAVGAVLAVGAWLVVFGGVL
jgi:hypothetical protein